MFTMKEYLENEDANRHTENYYRLALEFGTPQEVYKVCKIKERNAINGHTHPEDNDWMYCNINPYYRILKDSSKNHVRTLTFIDDKYYRMKWVPGKGTMLVPEEVA